MLETDGAEVQMNLKEWIGLFIESHPSNDGILKIDVEFGKALVPYLIGTDGEDGSMIALGMSLALSHAGKLGLPMDLPEWLVAESTCAVEPRPASTI